MRVVHRWFADNDDWDGQFEGVEKGWPAFFRILRLYRTHFGGMPSSGFQLVGFAPGPTQDAWASLRGSLGFDAAVVGQGVRTAAGAPSMAGTIEHTREGNSPELLLRLGEPTPGVAHLFAMSMGAQVYLGINAYLYGDRAAAAVARDEPAWQAWIAQHFPAAMDSGATT